MTELQHSPQSAVRIQGRPFTVYRKFDLSEPWRSMAYSIRLETEDMRYIREYANCKSYWQLRQGQHVVETWLYDGSRFLKAVSGVTKKDIT